MVAVNAMSAVIVPPPTGHEHIPAPLAIVALCALGVCALWLLWIGLQLFGPSRRR
jgi:hypothetical protein